MRKNHQIQYEIIAPIVSNLLKDTRKERIEIYNHIKDQKLSYLNKWHQDTEDFYGRNRAEAADIINLMRSTLSEYSAAYNTLTAYKKTEATMKAEQSLESAVTETQDNSAEVLAGYQAQAQQVTQTQQEFSDYMDRLHEDIDARAEKFGYVEYYDASLRDKKARDTAVAAENVNLLDERRKPLAEVNPLLAQNSELPPEPSIEKEAYEYAGINLNAVAKEALDELDGVEHSSVSHDATEPQEEDVAQEPEVQQMADESQEPELPQESDESQDEEEIVTVNSVRSKLEELKELDVDEEYNLDELSTMFESIQEQIQTASTEEEMNAAFEQLHYLNETADSIKAQLSGSEESDDEDENDDEADFNSQEEE